MKEILIESKNNFIEQGALLLAHKLALATGVPKADLPLDPDTLSSAYTTTLLDHYYPLLEKIEITSKIQAESTKDVIALLGQGKLGINEATQLIQLIKSAEVEAPLEKGVVPTGSVLKIEVLPGHN